MRRLAVIALSFALPLAATFACGEDASRTASSAPPSGGDGGATDVSLGANPSAASDAAEAPVGDLCGDRAGLAPSPAWPMTGGCGTRSGVSASFAPQATTSPWSFPAATGESAPAVDLSGFVWVGSTDGAIYALRGGVVQLAHFTGAPIRSSFVIDAAGRAIVGSDDGTLYAFEGRSGIPIDAGGVLYDGAKVAFSLPLGGPVRSSPVIGGNGTIFVGTTDGNLHAVSAAGAIAWTVPTNDSGGSSPAIGLDGTIYVGSTDRKLYAVRQDGKPGWALDLGAEIHGSPAVGGDGTIYVGSADGVVHAITPAGNERWAAPIGGDIVGAPAVRAEVVYVGSTDKSLYALSVVDGSKRFSYATLGAVATPVIDGQGKIVFGSSDGRVYVLSPSGNLVFAVNAKGKIVRGVAIASNMTYVATDKGVVALGP